MHNLKDIQQWKNKLGLLPIKLFSHEIENDYILLNGGTGDFCLQLAGLQNDKEHYFSSAWSSNTKNYVVIAEDFIKLYNWKKDKVEDIKRKSVEDNYEKFYDYLLSNSIGSDSDIVPFVINIYRKLRNLVNDSKNGIESLNLLFVLLASYEDSLNDINLERWGMQALPNLPIDFERYINEFSEGVAGKKPNLELLLRHSSGVLFQEAQREAIYFNKNLDLFSGTLSSVYTTKKSLYSSIHYTPAYLARTIVENTLASIDLNSKKSLKILDPSCGSSEFLMEVLKQLKAKKFTGNVHVTGWDTSESAINTSKFLLQYEKREWNNLLTVDIRLVEDSLMESWEHQDIILMNPPFVSWEQMPKDARDAVRESLHSVFDGKPNQASAFFYKAVNALNFEGVIGCVVPSSTLNLDSYRKLRTEVADNISFLLVGKLGNYIFEDALTDVSIIVGKKPKGCEAPTLIWTKNEKGIAVDALRDLRKMQYSNLPMVDEKEYSIFQPAIFPIQEESWKPISFKENTIFNKIQRLIKNGDLVRIGDVFNVQQGIRSGNNYVFKLSSEDFLRIPDSEKKYFKPVIDNDSIKKGVLTKKNYIWYPYNERGLIFTSEENLSEQVPHFFSTILKPNQKILQGRKGITEWWGLTRPRNWQFELKRGICSTEFGRSDSFAFDIKGEFVIERGNAWIPKKNFEIDDYHFYLSILTSPTFDLLLSIYSKQLAGGNWYDLGKKFTRNIPIPKIPKDCTNNPVYLQLVHWGKELSNGEFYDYSQRENILKEFIYPSL